jgi:hypothetical protein
MKQQRVRRIDTPFGRAYAYGKGKDAILMPSVTTILGSESSPYLEELEAKIGKEELAKISQRAAFRGTAMHLFLENYFICRQNGGDGDKCLLYTQKKTPGDLREDGIADDRIAWGRDLFYNFIHDDIFGQIKKILFTEQFMWSVSNLFAGTADFGFVRAIDDGLVISDFKSASGHRGEDVIKKYKKQLAAYVIAYEEINNKRITNAQVWLSSPEGMQIEILEGEELEQTKIEFLDLCKRFHESWDIQPIREYYINNYCTEKKD